jgi:hypothetical protein
MAFLECFQPKLPAGMMKTFAYPSFSAATAAVWQACQSSLAQEKVSAAPLVRRADRRFIAHERNRTEENE